MKVTTYYRQANQMCTKEEEEEEEEEEEKVGARNLKNLWEFEIKRMTLF